MNTARPKLDTACPQCSSNDTQKFEMAFHAGTSSGRVSMGTYSGGDGFGVAGGSMQTQTLLARKLTPPTGPSYVGAGVISFLLVFALVIIVSFAAAFISSPVALAVFVIGVAFSPFLTFGLYFVAFARDLREQTQKFKVAMSRWSRSWICLRCGNGWIPRPAPKQTTFTPLPGNSEQPPLATYPLPTPLQTQAPNP